MEGVNPTKRYFKHIVNITMHTPVQLLYANKIIKTKPGRINPWCVISRESGRGWSQEQTRARPVTVLARGETFGSLLHFCFEKRR
jgi:hypothetical protein